MNSSPHSHAGLQLAHRRRAIRTIKTRTLEQIARDAARYTKDNNKR